MEAAAVWTPVVDGVRPVDRGIVWTLLRGFWQGLVSHACMCCYKPTEQSITSVDQYKRDIKGPSLAGDGQDGLLHNRQGRQHRRNHANQCIGERAKRQRIGFLCRQRCSAEAMCTACVKTHGGINIP